MTRLKFLIVVMAYLSCAMVWAQEETCTGKTYYSLEEALKEPESVTVLDIAMQDPKLTEVPAEIGLLVNLECLDLSFNRIGTLPEEFKNLKNLKVLVLAGNRYMASFPEVLKELPQLTKVDFTDIPEWSKEKCEMAKEALPNVTVLTDK